MLGPLFKLFEALLELLSPLVVASLIDVGINGGGGRGYAVKMSLMLVLLVLVGLIFSVTAQYFSAKAAVGYTARLKSALFDHIQELSFTGLDKLGSSSMITLMTGDMNQIQNGVNLTLRLLLRAPFIVFGAMIMAFTIDTKAALIFVGVIPLLFIVVFAIMLTTIPLYKKVQGSLERVLGVTRNNLAGVRVLRAFGLEQKEREHFSEKNEQLYDIQKYVGKISALLNPLTFIVINGAVVLLIYTGAIRVELGILTQGAVIALYNYMSQILVELIKLANLIITITKSVASLKRVSEAFEYSSTDEAVDQAKRKGKTDDHLVAFRNVSLTYEGGGSPALSDISFTADGGETIGIIGGTGSGKSSLVGLIPRFYSADEGGVVTVDGVDVREYEIGELRRRVGIVMQKAVLFSGSIRENLLWGNPNATDEQLYEALRIAQALDVVNDKEGGLDYTLEQGGRNLSGGQRQRLTIARALVAKPQILILDDSASALDYATDAALRHALSDMETVGAVFIVSQRTSSIRHADKIIVLDDGRMVGIGTHDQLLESCEVYKEIYNTQFKKEAV